MVSLKKKINIRKQLALCWPTSAWIPFLKPFGLSRLSITIKHGRNIFIYFFILIFHMYTLFETFTLYLYSIFMWWTPRLIILINSLFYVLYHDGSRIISKTISLWGFYEIVYNFKTIISPRKVLITNILRRESTLQSNLCYCHPHPGESLYFYLLDYGRSIITTSGYGKKFKYFSLLIYFTFFFWKTLTFSIFMWTPWLITHLLSIICITVLYNGCSIVHLALSFYSWIECKLKIIHKLIWIEAQTPV